MVELVLVENEYFCCKIPSRRTIMSATCMLTNRFVGIFTSLLVPETKKTLEELTGEDHYYDGSSREDSGANSVEGVRGV